jgi:hypothetical protein
MDGMDGMDDKADKARMMRMPDTVDPESHHGRTTDSVINSLP